ncbi:MAG: NAD(P)H-dependent oxidoreductase [Bacteroidia bacterium]
MITIIAGTNRPFSNSRVVADVYAATLRRMDANCEVLDLQGLPPDFMFSAMFDNAGKDPEFNKFQQVIDASEKFVIIIPEYNGSFPGVLKAFFDALDYPGSLAGKVCALVAISSGSQGGSLALSHFTDILNYLDMPVLPQKPRLSFIHQHLEEQELTHRPFMSLIEIQAKALLDYNG